MDAARRLFSRKSSPSASQSCGRRGTPPGGGRAATRCTPRRRTCARRACTRASGARPCTRRIHRRGAQQRRRHRSARHPQRPPEQKKKQAQQQQQVQQQEQQQQQQQQPHSHDPLPHGGHRSARTTRVTQPRPTSCCMAHRSPNRANGHAPLPCARALQARRQWHRGRLGRAPPRPGRLRLHVVLLARRALDARPQAFLPAPPPALLQREH